MPVEQRNYPGGPGDFGRVCDCCGHYELAHGRDGHCLAAARAGHRSDGKRSNIMCKCRLFTAAEKHRCDSAAGDARA
jgi:hypothetical protein